MSDNPKKETTELRKNLNRNFPFFIYLFALGSYSFILYTARKMGLLPFPLEGTDQLSMLKTAADLYRGELPPSGYLYSPAYTLFLYFLILISQGNLIIMRLLQAATCAFIPLIIYKLGLKIRLGYDTAQTASLIYCFYGPAALISLDFLRAAPLSLCFILSVYFLARGFTSKKILSYFLSGIFAGLCVLGRENFIPVVAAPLLFLTFKNIRKYVRGNHIISYASGIAILVLPILIYNCCRFGSFSIIPGALQNILSIFHGSSAEIGLNETLFCVILKKIPLQIFKFISSYENPNSLSFYAHREVIDFLWIFIIPFNLLIALSIISISFYKSNRYILFPAFSAFVFFLSMLYFEIFYRYRIPVVPILCLLAGAGVNVIIRQKSVYKRTILIAAVSVFFLLTYTWPNKLRPVKERLAVVDVLISNKNFARAENHLEKLQEESTDISPQLAHLIAALRKDGQFERAAIAAMRLQKPGKQK